MGPTKKDDDDGSAGSDSARSGGGDDHHPKRKKGPIVKDRESYPSTGIVKPGPNDVLCGRGGGTNNHSGNVRFRKLVNEHKMRYLAATKVEKPKVAREVVKIWRAMDPPGRFLARSGEGGGGGEDGSGGGSRGGNKGDAVWHDVGDKKAREKASQCLRERTPEVMPFVKKLQAQQQVALAPKEEERAAAAAAQVAAAAAAQADPGFFNGGGHGAVADPAMSAQLAAAAAAQQRHRQHQGLSPDTAAAAAYGFGGQQGGGHPNPPSRPHSAASSASSAAAISSQFLVAAPGSSASSSAAAAAQLHHHQQQGQGAWAFANSEDFSGQGGFTQFTNNAFQQQAQQQQFQQLQAQQQAMVAAAALQQQQAGLHQPNGGMMGQPGGPAQASAAGESDELTLEEYQRSMEEYISRECGLSPEDAARAVDPNEARREAMEEVRGTSWIKSFHSIDTNSLSMDMASVTSQSIRNMAIAELAATREREDEEDDDDEEEENDVILEEESGMYSNSRDTRSRRTGRSSAEFSSSTVKTAHLDAPLPPPATHHHHGANVSGRSLKSRGTASKKSRHTELSSSASNISMFTDTSGMTSVGDGLSSAQKSRDAKMSAARTLKSDISMMSELTDLSANMSIGSRR